MSSSTGPQNTESTSTWPCLRDDITGSLKNIVAIDAGAMSGFDRAAFVGSISGKLNRLAESGDVETVEKALDHIRQFDQGRDKPTFTDRHRIWSLADAARAARGDRTDTVRENETVAAGDGFSIIANHALDRVQILFDAKPESET